jgi:hypothetical protein
MRFLVTTDPKHMAPPELIPMLIDGMDGWLSKYKSNFVAVWSSAGKPGGGGIVEVDSPEQLDQMMIEFPFGPFSEIRIMPIVELRESLRKVKAHFEQVAAMMRQAGS